MKQIFLVPNDYVAYVVAMRKLGSQETHVVPWLPATSNSRVARASAKACNLEEAKQAQSENREIAREFFAVMTTVTYERI